MQKQGEHGGKFENLIRKILFFLLFEGIHHFDGQREDYGGVFLSCYGVQCLQVPVWVGWGMDGRERLVGGWESNKMDKSLVDG